MWRFRCNSLKMWGCGGRLFRQISCNLFLISTTQVLHATGFRGRKDTVLSWELFTEPVRFPLIFFWHQQLALPSFRGHWLHLSQLYNIPLPIFTQAQCCVSQCSVIRQGGVCGDVHDSEHILLGILYPSSVKPDLLHVCWLNWLLPFWRLVNNVIHTVVKYSSHPKFKRHFSLISSYHVPWILHLG